MAARIGSYIGLTVLTVALVATGCGDDDDNLPSGSAGESSAGEGSGGSASGKGGSGTTAGTAGSSNGGKGGSGGSAEAGAPEGGALSQAGNPGAGGEVSLAGAGAGGAGGAGGATGDGGAPGIVWACKDTTIYHQLCSTLATRICTETRTCSECVAERVTEGADFEQCSTCGNLHHQYLQCVIDGLVNGDPASTTQCVDGYGADGSDDCVAQFENDAIACSIYVSAPNPCPGTWPPG